MAGRFDIPGVTPSAELRVAAPALLRAKAAPLFALEEAARGGADADAVHDMRVASRRLREAMRLLEPLYPRAPFRAWYRRVRRITRALGPVRDADVFIEAFGRLGPGLGEDGRRALAFVIGYRAGRRAEELAVLDRELAGLDLADARASFERLADAVADVPASRLTLAGFAHEQVAARLAVVAADQPAALDEACVTEQHELRIAYKRLRYAAESFAPCYGDGFRSLHRTLTTFQDTLGELHDAHVFLDVLGELARTPSAEAAGIRPRDMDELSDRLYARAHEEFERFAALAREHPADALAADLLVPLESASAAR